MQTIKVFVILLLIAAAVLVVVGMRDLKSQKNYATQWFAKPAAAKVVSHVARNTQAHGSKTKAAVHAG